jgi:hypothetical protein
MYPLQLEFNYGNGQTVTQAFDLSVGRIPVITSSNSFTMGEGVASSFTITTAGAPKASLSLLDGALPAGVALQDNGDGTATISGIPAAGTAGTYPLTLRAKNGILPNGKQTFTLTVEPASGPEFTSAARATFVTGGSNSFTISTTAAPSAALTLTSGSLPPGLTFVDNHNGTATLSGKAAA